VEIARRRQAGRLTCLAHACVRSRPPAATRRRVGRRPLVRPAPVDRGEQQGHRPCRWLWAGRSAGSSSAS